MLKYHFAAVEKKLLAEFDMQKHAGHNLHKGNPREWFISQFLENHLPQRISIGTGEIIDANSKQGESRNQNDIVLYLDNFPKLNFGGITDCFLAESVVATVEVKSNLTEVEFEKAVKSAYNTKKLSLNKANEYVFGGVSSSIRSFIIAYDGPVNHSTLANWVEKVYKKLNIPLNALPNSPERVLQSASAIDGVFILNKGYVLFDNHTISLMPETARNRCSWTGCSEDVLLMFFLLLTNLSSSVSIFNVDITKYLKNIIFNSTHYEVAKNIVKPFQISSFETDLGIPSTTTGNFINDTGAFNVNTSPELS